ncbi:MAG: hypothetical protein ABIY55_06485, partial [Kofleriaceae bacterium]
MRSLGLVAAAVLASAAPVHADEPTPAAASADAQLLERMQRLEDELATLREDNAVLERKAAAVQLLSARFSGYLDVGLFATTGNGAGTRSDIGNVYFPRYAGTVPGSWVFMGDPLSTAVNSRGDPADTGESRAVTFDPIDSRGNSSFIVNALNLGLLVGLADTASLVSSVDFVPRGRDVSNPA